MWNISCTVKVRGTRLFPRGQLTARLGGKIQTNLKREYPDGKYTFISRPERRHDLILISRDTDDRAEVENERGRVAYWDNAIANALKDERGRWPGKVARLVKRLVLRKNRDIIERAFGISHEHRIRRLEEC